MRHRLAYFALAFAVAFASRAAFAKSCPNIMLVLDQSSSMAQDPNGGNTMPSKWQLLQQAVVDLVNQYGDRVPFGVELFQSDSFRDDTKCYTDTMISVEPAHDTATQIIQTVQGAQPVPMSHTNTGEAIERAAVDPVMMDTTRDNFIILVTDGTPSCNSLDLMTGTADFTIMQINNALNQNPPVKTWVIGFDGGGTGTDKSNLDAMARSGGEPVMGCGGTVPCYYSATDATAFTNALSKVIDTIVGGEFGMVGCDDSCYTNGCQPGYVCTKSETDPVATCKPDPCQGMSCGGSTFCRMGQCVQACTDGCKGGTMCVNGQCVNDPCSGSSCSMTTGMTCDPTSGKCIPDLCTGRTCNGPTACDPSSGKCIDDQCHIITCPAGTMCVTGGNCSAPYNNGRGKGGCSIGRRDDPLAVGAALALAALLGLALAARRRL
jgi:hypothetical protein